MSCHLACNLLKGKADWNIENTAELKKPAGAALIFWDLLECQSNLVSKVFLEQPKKGPAISGPVADMDFNRADNSAAAVSCLRGAGIGYDGAIDRSAQVF